MKFDLGDRVKIISTTSNHGQEIGSTFTIRMPYFNGAQEGYYVNENAAYFFAADLELSAYTRELAEEKIEEIEAGIDKLYDEVNFYEEVIEALEQDNVDEILPGNFKKFRLKKILAAEEEEEEAKAERILKVFNDIP